MNASKVLGCGPPGRGGLALRSRLGKYSCRENVKGWPWQPGRAPHPGNRSSKEGAGGAKVKGRCWGHCGAGVWGEPADLGEAQRQRKGRMSPLLFASAVMREADCPSHDGISGGVVSMLGYDQTFPAWTCILRGLCHVHQQTGNPLAAHCRENPYPYGQCTRKSQRDPRECWKPAWIGGERSQTTWGEQQLR